MFLRFVRWAGFVCGTWYKIGNDRTDLSQGGQMPVSPRKLGLRINYFSESLTSASYIPINWFDSCNDSFFLWISHCTRVRFTVTVSCSDGLEVHSCLVLYLQRRVVKVASGLFCFWSLLRNNTVATNPQRSLYITVAGVLLRETWTQTSWQVMQRDSDMLIAVSYVAYICTLWNEAWVSP